MSGRGITPKKIVASGRRRPGSSAVSRFDREFFNCKISGAITPREGALIRGLMTAGVEFPRHIEDEARRKS